MWIVDLIMKGKTVQLLEKNNGGYTLISMQANTFYPVITMKEKIGRLDFLNFKNFS